MNALILVKISICTPRYCELFVERCIFTIPRAFGVH